MNPYDFAMQMSRDGEKFFRVLRRQVRSRDVRRILTLLAKDQVLYRRDLARMKKEEGNSPAADWNLAGTLNPFAERLERLAGGEWLYENVSPPEFHRTGQKLARECEEFYRKRAARVKDPRLRQAFLGVVEVHRKHCRTIESLIQQRAEDSDSKDRSL